MNIIVLTGGNSAERNVSLASGKAITRGLREAGHEVKAVDPVFGAAQPDEEKIFGRSNAIGDEFPTPEELKNYHGKKVIECIQSGLFDNTDIVFLGLHGKFGEDGRIQSMLELSEVKYTGSGVISSAMAMDKNISKILFQRYNIPTPDWFMMNSKTVNETEADAKIKEITGYPVVIKPNDEGSTVGLSIVQPDVEDIQLGKALSDAFSYSDSVMAEQFIEGRELTVAVLGNEALPVVEIKPKDGFYDYLHKYTKGYTDYYCPADLPEKLTRELQEKSLLAHNSLQCRAYSRVDFRLKPNGEYFCLEVNTLPGMTELSLVPKAAGALGITFPELLNRIIELSLK